MDERVEKVKLLLENEEIAEKMSKMETAEEILAFFENEGIIFTEEELDMLCMKETELSNDGELAPEEMEQVSGGIISLIGLLLSYQNKNIYKPISPFSNARNPRRKRK